MKASARWLRELLNTPDLPTHEIASLLTKGGLEVEGITTHGLGLHQVVVAEVRSKRPHPKKDRVTLVTVYDGEAEHEIVCGASNVPARGGRVLMAKVGATLPNGITIAPRDVGGVTSSGMLCSEAELGLGSDAEGILVLDDGDPGELGQPIATALFLRDDVLELSVTPNRPDALGHLGIARELAAHLGKAFVPRIDVVPSRLLSEQPSVTAPSVARPLIEEGTAAFDTLSMFQTQAGVPAALPIRIDAADRCARYLGLVVQNVKRTRSRFRARHRLHVLGLRAIDPVVDATNWALSLFGNPVHAFDLEKLAGPEIIVRLATEGEVFVALDGTEHRLSADDLVIADAKGPVALAGVMGGKDSGVTETTEHVLLEVAYFEPRTVRRTARRHGFHTDSSHRFERGVDPTALDKVMAALATEVARTTTGAPSPTVIDCTADPSKLVPRTIVLPDAMASEVIGSPVDPKDTRAILEALGCIVSPGEARGEVRVLTPGHRPDLLRPIDLVEEVARMRGYDRLEARLIRVSADNAKARPRPAAVRAVRRAALAAGLHEALTHGLVTSKLLEQARAPEADVRLVNPISEERAVLRSSLLPGLLLAVQRSERRGDRRVRLFELSRVYAGANTIAAGEVPVRESLSFCAVMAGPRDRWLGSEEQVDFWDVKGALLAMGQVLGMTLRIERGEGFVAPGHLHPQRSADVWLGDVRLGSLGELHPDVTDAFELRAPAMVISMDGEQLVASVQTRAPVQVQPMPRFPSVERDLALIVDDAIQAAQVAQLIAASSPLIEAVALFDLYRGKPIAEGKKSLAFRIAYRDPEATLTDAKVEALHQAALKQASEAFGAELR